MSPSGFLDDLRKTMAAIEDLLNRNATIRTAWFLVGWLLGGLSKETRELYPLFEKYIDAQFGGVGNREEAINALLAYGSHRTGRQIKSEDVHIKSTIKDVCQIVDNGGFISFTDTVANVQIMCHHYLLVHLAGPGQLYTGIADIFGAKLNNKGNRFTCIRTKFAIDPVCRNADTEKLVDTIYHDNNWSLCPILGDALEEAGCCNCTLLNHLREPQHKRGCWAIDLLRQQK